MSREVTASIYDLMGHPGGERERSEAAEQHITRRADLLFQVGGKEEDLDLYEGVGRGRGPHKISFHRDLIWTATGWFLWRSFSQLVSR